MSSVSGMQTGRTDYQQKAMERVVSDEPDQTGQRGAAAETPSEKDGSQVDGSAVVSITSLCSEANAKVQQAETGVTSTSSEELDKKAKELLAMGPEKMAATLSNMKREDASSLVGWMASQASEGGFYWNEVATIMSSLTKTPKESNFMDCFVTEMRKTGPGEMFIFRMVESDGGDEIILHINDPLLSKKILEQLNPQVAANILMSMVNKGDRQAAADIVSLMHPCVAACTLPKCESAKDILLDTVAVKEQAKAAMIKRLIVLLPKLLDAKPQDAAKALSISKEQDAAVVVAWMITSGKQDDVNGIMSELVKIKDGLKAAAIITEMVNTPKSLNESKVPLASILAAMGPQDAANILKHIADKLGKQSAADIVAEMRSCTAAYILANYKGAKDILDAVAVNNPAKAEVTNSMIEVVPKLLAAKPQDAAKTLNALAQKNIFDATLIFSWMIDAHHEKFSKIYKEMQKTPEGNNAVQAIYNHFMEHSREMVL